MSSQLDKSVIKTMEYCSAELLASHKMLDSIGIPQSGYDEQLSISQRVEMAVSEIKRFRLERSCAKKC